MDHNPDADHCACGQPMHYTDPKNKEMVDELVAMLGRFVHVNTEFGTYKVDRHFIALHGLKSNEVTALGFERLDDVPEEDEEWAMYNIFAGPLDYPNEVVIRPVLINKARDGVEPRPLCLVWRFTSIPEARRFVAMKKPSAICLPRSIEDVTSLVESWF